MTTLHITATCDNVEMDLPYSQESVERFLSDALDGMLQRLGSYGMITYDVVIQKEEGGDNE